MSINISKKVISNIYKNSYITGLVLVNISLQVSSFILVKVAAINAVSYTSIFFNIFYISALSLSVFRSIVWQLILKKNELSKVYPINSVVPILILLSGFVFFDEHISNNNIAGAILLMLGVYLIVEKS